MMLERLDAPTTPPLARTPSQPCLLFEVGTGPCWAPHCGRPQPPGGGSEIMIAESAILCMRLSLCRRTMLVSIAVDANSLLEAGLSS